MSLPLIIILGIFYGLLGLCLGSFSNVLIYRLSNNVSLLKEKRSICPNCKNEIKWYDNIPIISYIILKGKCRSCHEKINPRYLIMEILGLIIFISCFFMNFTYPGFTFSFNYKSIIYPFIALILIVIAIIDYKIYEIPFTLSIPLMILSVTIYVTDCILANNYLLDNILGFVIPVVFFGIIYAVFAVFFKKEVLGIGDIILFAFIGLFLNYKHFILILILSCFICSIVELIKMKIKKEKSMIAFGPYIAIATIISMAVGDLIINSYLSLFGL